MAENGSAPKVSVCMVTYNQERYIAQAIESVLAQETNFRIEIVLGEDCSTDGTRQIVERFAAANPEIIQLRLAEQNRGAKLNFVGVFGQARGEYVVILEGDDYFTDPLKLQRQVEALDAHPDWALCFHPASCRYEGDLQGPAVMPEGWDRSEATIVDLFAQNFIPTCGAMFRNRLYPSLPTWFMSIDAGDWALHILNAAHGNIGFLPEVMSAYRIHPAGNWSGRSAEQRVVSIFELLTAVDHHFQGKYAAEIDRNRSSTIQWLFGEWYNAKEEARKAIEVLGAMTSDGLLRRRATLGKEHNLSCEEVKQVAAQTANSRHYHSIAQLFEALLDEQAKLRAAHLEWTNSLAYKIPREIMRPWRKLRAKFRGLKGDRVDPADDSAPPSAKAA